MTSVHRTLPTFLIALVATAAASCAGADADDARQASVDDTAASWGFVATLGNDTTSVEWITREGDRITGVALGRSPRVVLRRWEATFGPDGSVRRWSMDTRVANAPADQAELHHVFAVDGGQIRLLRSVGSDSTSGSIDAPYPRNVPWNAFLYATYESLVNTARDAADTSRIGIYFFEGWQEGRMGYARVRDLGGDSVAVMSSGLSGEGVAHMDGAGRMLSYSGAGTTYKQEVRRVDSVPDIDATFARYAEDERARGVSPVLSARDTTRATVGGVNIEVDYSRPLGRGRTLVGGIIPYDRVWRTGANAATHLTVSAPLRLAGVPLERGSYTLWTLPSRDGVQLIINRQTGQWGTGYGAAHDIARVPMRVETADAPVEQFTIGVDRAASRLFMEWGTFRWSVPIAPGT